MLRRVVIFVVRIATVGICLHALVALVLGRGKQPNSFVKQQHVDRSQPEGGDLLEMAGGLGAKRSALRVFGKKDKRFVIARSAISNVALQDVVPVRGWYWIIEHSLNHHCVRGKAFLESTGDRGFVFAAPNSLLERSRLEAYAARRKIEQYFRIVPLDQMLAIAGMQTCQEWLELE